MVNCTKCNEVKELEAFRIHKKRQQRHAWCKECEWNCAKVYKKNNVKKVRADNKKWKNDNKDKGRFHAMKRVAAKLQATPKWLTPEQLDQIQEFYTLAVELQWLAEEPLQVDHIEPLQGKISCGLHVPWNLQILSASKNRSKGNKLGW